jgi:hypothetical protein
LDKELCSSIHYYHIAFRSYDPHQQRLANAYALQFQSQPQQQLVKWKLAIRPPSSWLGDWLVSLIRSSSCGWLS